MRFRRYLVEDNINIIGFAYLFGGVNEVNDEVLSKLQQLGRKVGLKVAKSKTFQEQLSTAGKGVLHLMKLLADYAVHTDILDTPARKKLEQEIKTQFSTVKKEDVLSFMVNLDKSFFGITAIPRHILQNLVGVSITSYDNWKSNAEYVEDNMRKIISVLSNMNDKESLELAKRIYFNVSGKKI